MDYGFELGIRFVGVGRNDQVPVLLGFLLYVKGHLAEEIVRYVRDDHTNQIGSACS